MYILKKKIAIEILPNQTTPLNPSPREIFKIPTLPGIKWEYNKDICQPFIDFEKAYDSIKRESLYDILIKVWVPKI